MNNAHKYTNEDIEFIKNNIDELSYRQMAACFEKKYGKKFHYDSIAHVAKRHGFKKNIRVYADRKNSEIRAYYSDEQLSFLKETFSKTVKWQELTDLFNEKFKTNYTYYEIAGICKRKFGFNMENYGTFRRGKHTFSFPVGTEKVGKNGITYIKISDKELPSGNSGNWVRKSKFVYESVYGKQPKGSQVICLDGDKSNVDIENLYCIDRKTGALLARENWYKNDRELTLTAVKCAELMCILKESEE